MNSSTFLFPLMDDTSTILLEHPSSIPDGRKQMLCPDMAFKRVYNLQFYTSRIGMTCQLVTELTTLTQTLKLLKGEYVINFKTFSPSKCIASNATNINISPSKNCTLLHCFYEKISIVNCNVMYGTQLIPRSCLHKYAV